MGILNDVWAQSPEERECRRESENPGPQQTFCVWLMELLPLTNRNIIHKQGFVKWFVKKKFGIFILGYFSQENKPVYAD